MAFVAVAQKSPRLLANMSRRHVDNYHELMLPIVPFRPVAVVGFANGTGGVSAVAVDRHAELIAKIGWATLKHSRDR